MEPRASAWASEASAIKALAGIMNEKTCAPAARVSAASALLDRGWGKPSQHLDVSTELSLLDVFAEIAAQESAGADEPQPDDGTVH